MEKEPPPRWGRRAQRLTAGIETADGDATILPSTTDPGTRKFLVYVRSVSAWYTLSGLWRNLSPTGGRSIGRIL